MASHFMFSSYRTIKMKFRRLRHTILENSFLLHIILKF